MENVYLDLRLEEYHDHPDNRGWMNLFRHWSWSGMFRATWAITVSTYGARFQEFCRRHLDLDYGPLQVTSIFRYENSDPIGCEPDKLAQNVRARLESFTTLNFVEHDRIAQTASSLLRTGVFFCAMEVLQITLRIGIPKIPAAELKFPIAFLLAYRDALGAAYVADFRVRDHLQRMGLARQALTRVHAERPDLKSAGLDVFAALHDEEGLRFAREFGSIFDA